MFLNKSISKTIFVLSYYVLTLLLFDVILILIGGFQPKYSYGNKDVGFGYPVEINHVSFDPVDSPDVPTHRETTNSMGFKEVTEPEIPFDGIRVLFLGDSHMQGQCSNAETIPDRFESFANAGQSIKYDAQNGGYGGQSPAQYARVLIHKGLKLQPDIVVVGIYIGNDFFDLMRRDDRPWASLNDNHLVWHEPDWVVFKNPDFKNSLLSKSRIYFLFNRIYVKTLKYTYSRAKYLYESAPKEVSFMKVFSFLNDIRIGKQFGKNWWNQNLIQHLYFKTFNKIDYTDELMKHIIMLYQEICSRHNIRLVIAPIPSAFQIYPTKIAERYKPLQHEIPELGSFDTVLKFLDKRYDFIKNVCNELNIEFYDLRIPLKRNALKNELYYPIDFHINPKGNTVVAQFLAKQILNNNNKDH